MIKTEIKVGTGCNNDCIFCLNKRRDLNKTTQQIFDEINQAKKKGIQNIQFTGGEITIRKDFFQILKYTKNKGLSILLQTNGRAFSIEKFAENVCSFGIHYFLISIHSHNEELNLKQTGVKNGFRQTIEGIKNLKKLNQKITTNTVVNKLNINYLEEILQKIIDLNVNHTQLSWCRIEGKVRKNYLSLVPKFSEGAKLIEKILSKYNNNPTPISLINFPPCLLNKKFAGCMARPYKDVFIIDEDLIPVEEISKKYKKERLPICDSCKKCEGITKDYLSIYGNSEFVKRSEKYSLDDQKDNHPN